jgi:hypothetical protein
MTTSKKAIFICLFSGIILLTGLSCGKTSSTPASLLNIKQEGDQDYLPVENITGSWDKETASLCCTGTKLETFRLKLIKPSPGIYPEPGINNFYFSDGVDFKPIVLESGSINIISVSEQEVRGEFNVVLHDEFNGAESRTFSGYFSISGK